MVSEAWEVKGTSGLTTIGPGLLTPRPSLLPQPTHTAQSWRLAEGGVLVEGLFEQLGAGK